MPHFIKVQNSDLVWAVKIWTFLWGWAIIFPFFSPQNIGSFCPLYILQFKLKSSKIFKDLSESDLFIFNNSPLKNTNIFGPSLYPYLYSIPPIAKKNSFFLLSWRQHNIGSFCPLFSVELVQKIQMFLQTEEWGYTELPDLYFSFKCSQLSRDRR